MLIESIAYRLGAHSTSDDPSGYRSKEEEADHQLNCPIARFKKWLVAQNWLDEAQDDAEKETIREQILEAVKVAEKVEKPALESLISDVYDTPIPELSEQYEHLKAHILAHPDAYPTTAGRIK